MAAPRVDRRLAIQGVAACGLLAAATRAAAAVGIAADARMRLKLEQRTLRDDLLIWAKLKADLSGRTLYAITAGTVWGFRPQADDLRLADFATRLYGYATCIARRGSVAADGNVVLQTKSWNFYLDPETGAFTTRLLNPYTGRMVTAAPMIAPTRQQAYSVTGPIAAAPTIPLEMVKPARPFDLRIRVVDQHAFVSESSFVRFKPADITWYKLEGTLWSHSCLLRDLQDSARTHIPSTWSQNLVAEWQTWMDMHGSPGHILFQGDGCHLEHADQIPEDLRRSIETVTPGGLTETANWR